MFVPLRVPLKAVKPESYKLTLSIAHSQAVRPDADGLAWQKPQKEWLWPWGLPETLHPSGVRLGREVGVWGLGPRV